MTTRLAGLAAFAAVLLASWTPAAAADRHAGYYYPQPRSEETYQARSQTLADADRKRRLGFVSGLTARMMANPYPPPFAVFAKGEEAEKLIVVGLQDGTLNSIYRARALFAMLTTTARASEFFREHYVDDYFTFFDLAKLLGFVQIVVTDGQRFSHRVVIR